MDSPTDADSPTGRLRDRIAGAVKKAKNRRAVEDREFIEMLLRQFRALEQRVDERPENLPQIMTLVERLAEIPNVVIANNADRYKLDPALGWSMGECARVLGMTDPAASKRRKKGNEVLNARHAAAGATRFPDARREQAAVAAAYQHVVDAIEATGDELSPAAQASRDRAVASIAVYRARHRAA